MMCARSMPLPFFIQTHIYNQINVNKRDKMISISQMTFVNLLIEIFGLIWFLRSKTHLVEN